MKVLLIFLTIFALAHLAESLDDDLERKHFMVGHSSDCGNGQACFRFQSSNETSSEYANWSGLVHCDDESECQGIFGNSIPTQCSKIYSHSRNGICAPRNCQHNNTDCPIIGDECTSGAISGECNNNSTQCDYAPFLMVAYCIPEGDRGRTSKVSNSCNSCGDGPGAACICKTLLHNASELLSVKFGIIEILVVYYLLK